MKVGLMVGKDVSSLEETARVATLAEESGLDSVWVPDLFRSFSVTAAVVAQATSRVQIGSCVSMGYARSPFLNARFTADLDELSNGRLIFGVGVGALDPGSADGWDVGRTRPPLAQLRHMVEMLRSSWHTMYDQPGSTLEYKSDHCVIDIFGPGVLAHPAARREIPLYLGVQKPRALQLAGEVADGLITFPLASERFIREEVRPHLAEGAQRSDRDADELELCSIIICCASEDRELARRLARRQLGYYAYEGAGTLSEALNRDGFATEWRRVRKGLFNESESMVRDAISDEMLDYYAVAGTPDEVKAKVDQLGELLDVAILEIPSVREDPKLFESLNRKVIEALA